MSTLPSSLLSISDIKFAFGMSYPLSFSHLYSKHQTVPSSGTISMSAFRGLVLSLESLGVNFLATGVSSGGSALIGGTTNIAGKCRLFTDSQNNSYLFGGYTAVSSITVRNLNGSNSTITLPASTASRPYVLVYNSSGVCITGSDLFSCSTTGSAATSLTVDTDGNIYVAGNYFGVVGAIKNLDSSLTTTTLPEPMTLS